MTTADLPVGGARPVRATAAPDHTLRRVTLIAAAAALGGFLFGYDSAVINGALTGIRDRFEVSSAPPGRSWPSPCWARRSAPPSPVGWRTSWAGSG